MDSLLSSASTYLIAFVGGVLSFFLKRIFSKVDALEKDVAKTNIEIAKNYVSKADYIQSNAELRSDVADMSKKLDKMLDLIYAKTEGK